MTIAALIMFIPFSILSLLGWIVVFFSKPTSELSIKGAVTLLISTLITAISAGIIFG